MTSLDPRLLLTFRAVARAGSLSAAARELGWTQPALGQQVKRLEQEAGLALVERTPRGVTLTDAGRALLVHADAVAGRLALAERDLERLRADDARHLQLLAPPSACPTIVAPAMAELARLDPPVEVSLTQMEPPEALAALQAGQADAAVVFHYDDVPETPLDPALDVEGLGDDPLRIIVSEHHRRPELRARPGAEAMDLARLAGDRWVAGCPRCRAHLLATAARHGFVPDIRHSTDDYTVVQGLVEAGLGVSLVPALALRAHHRPGVLAYRVDGDEAARHIQLVFRRTDRRPALALLRAAVGRAARLLP